MLELRDSTHAHFPTNHIIEERFAKFALDLPLRTVGKETAAAGQLSGRKGKTS